MIKCSFCPFICEEIDEEFHGKWNFVCRHHAKPVYYQQYGEEIITLYYTTFHREREYAVQTFLSSGPISSHFHPRGGGISWRLCSLKSGGDRLHNPDWSIIINWDYLPNVNPDNLDYKLPTILIFL